MTTSSGVSASIDSPGSREKSDALRPQLVVDVRVVDDFAGEEHRTIGKALARLVGVVDGAVDAVAEAEFAREMDASAGRRRTGNCCP